MIEYNRVNEIKRFIKNKNLIKKSLSQIAEENNITIKIIDLDNSKDISFFSFFWFITKTWNEKYNIYINKKDLKTQKFIIAHLLWYYFLYKDIIDEIGMISYPKENENSVLSDNIKVMIEEGEEFAYNLLVPENYYLDFYKKYTIPELSDIFSVPERIIAQRFSDLQIRYEL